MKNGLRMESCGLLMQVTEVTQLRYFSKVTCPPVHATWKWMSNESEPGEPPPSFRLSMLEPLGCLAHRSIPSISWRVAEKQDFI